MSIETTRFLRDGEGRGYRGVNMVLNVHRNRTVLLGTGYRGEGRGRLYTCRYTVNTRMTPALRWAAMRAILMFH